MQAPPETDVNHVIVIKLSRGKCQEGRHIKPGSVLVRRSRRFDERPKPVERNVSNQNFNSEMKKRESEL